MATMSPVASEKLKFVDVAPVVDPSKTYAVPAPALAKINPTLEAAAIAVVVAVLIGVSVAVLDV